MEQRQWDPQQFLRSFRREVDRVFEDVFSGWSHHRQHRHHRKGERDVIEPAVEVAETADAIVIKAQIPGVSKDDLSVEVTAEGLTIKGEAKTKEEEPGKRYHRQEICYGTLMRTVSFPVVVESDKAVASLKDGVLLVTVPKSAAGKTKPVKVEVT
jgi:HSP20 family protein